MSESHVVTHDDQLNESEPHVVTLDDQLYESELHVVTHNDQLRESESNGMISFCHRSRSMCVVC